MQRVTTTIQKAVLERLRERYGSIAAALRDLDNADTTSATDQEVALPNQNEPHGSAGLTREGQAEEQLRTTQQYLDTILLNLPVGVAILEGPDFRYYKINHRLAEINGLPVEDHLGRPLAAVLPEAAPDILPGLRHVLKTGEPRLDREFTTRLPKDPEVIRHFIDSFFPIQGADGKPMAVGAVVLEITERKQAEEALRKALNELEQRVRERTAAR